jgi:hypothetical protein
MFIIDLIYFSFKIIMFILIIYGVQYGWDTIADTYTKPKTKDLVNSQLKKYKDLLGEMQIPNDQALDNRVPEILFESDEDKKQMNDDLLSFMNDQTQIYKT